MDEGLKRWSRIGNIAARYRANITREEIKRQHTTEGSNERPYSRRVYMGLNGG